ncbi:MAG: PP2C family serine/threonine-protein phosphatase [Methanomicrobiales archaeon]|nr:PP2C family serine/threonine-protein phosphatase [Methanomicrobiales archaeon]
MRSDCGIIPLREAGIGWAFVCSCRGASHRRTNRPCQDASALWAGSYLAEPSVVAALADGHGDRQHDLSHAGALIAVREAIHILTSPRYSFERVGSATSAREIFGGEFAAQMTLRWREEVIEDARVRLGPDAIQTENGREMAIRRYGTTLLTASVQKDWIFTGRIGDGDIALIRPDGRIEHPVPEEGVLLGNITNSISSRNATTLWQSAILPRERGGLLLLATDGLSDSFGGSESPEFEVFLKSLGERIGEYGIERVAGSLPSWLAQYSELGSGDDITIAIVAIEPERCTEEIERNDRAKRRDPIEGGVIDDA